MGASANSAEPDRMPKMRRRIRIFIVLLIFEGQKKKNTLNNPKIGNGLVLLITIGTSIRFKCINLHCCYPTFHFAPVNYSKFNCFEPEQTGADPGFLERRVHMYKGVRAVSLCLFYLIFLKYPIKMK